MALIQNLAQGQEDLKVLVNQLRQDGYNCMGQRTRIRDQVTAQPPIRHGAGLRESRPSQFASTSWSQQWLRQHQPENQQRQSDPKRQFTNINMPLSQTLQHMLRVNLITTIRPHPNPKTFSPSYDPDARCACHSDSPRHNTNDYWALKYKIQNLIDRGALEFIQDGQLELFYHPSRASIWSGNKIK